MKKNLNKLLPFAIFIPLVMMVLSLLFLSTNLSQNAPTNQDIRSKAAENNIQTMIDAAKDGDTITIPPGSYSGGTAIPLASNRPFALDSRGASETCFIRIENKNINIIGNGVTLYGEGHSRPYQDPYQHRAGVCVLNSKVTFDGVRIKEFQKRGLVSIDSQIVYKNGVMDGSDEGGISLLGNSNALIVNNIFVGFNFGGVMLWQNSQAKIVNNIFYGANIAFFYHPNSNDLAHADIINNILTNGSAVTQVDWWTSELPKLKNNNLSYNLIWYGDKSCGANDFCDNFTGKVNADPLLNDAATDPTGWVYGSFDLRPESPAVGKGDPSMPGSSKNLGNSGGPCADGKSATCTAFISQNIPQSPQPTEIPTAIPPTQIPNPTSINPTSIYPTQTVPREPNTTTNPKEPKEKPTTSDNGPPITYYLPPTMSFENPNQPTINPSQNPPTPTITPTPKPLIDIAKTVENAKNSWNDFVNKLITLTKTILP